MKLDVHEKYKNADFAKAKRATEFEFLNRLRVEKTRITILIDAPVLDAFRKRSEAQGVGYQTLINQALRECIGLPSDVTADIRKLVRLEVKAALEETKRCMKAT